MASAQTEDPRVRVSSYLYFGSLYFISVGVLYLWGYWATFGVNILVYLSLTDVLKLTIYPIVSAFVMFALGAVMGEFLVARGSLIPSAGRDTTVGRFLSRFAPVLLLFYTLGTGALFVFGPDSKWQILPLLLGLPVYIAAKEQELLVSLLPNESIRSVVTFLLAMLPFWAYGHGRLEAAAVRDGTDYQYLVTSPNDSITVRKPQDPKARVKYVGHVNDYVFLLLPDNSTLAIIRFDQTSGLQLRRFKMSEESPKKGSNIGMQSTPKSGAADAQR